MLQRAGYENVTVLDKRPERVGGKCQTELVEGKAIDVGAIFVLPHYPIIQELAVRHGIRLRKAAPFHHQGLDGRKRPFGSPVPQLMTKAAEYLRLGGQLLRHHPLLSKPLGLLDAERMRELSIPYRDWVRKHRLDYFHEAAYPLLRSFGFGYEEHEIPALYILQTLPVFATGGNFLSLWDLSSLPLYYVEEGYGELWRRVAQPFQVRTGVNIRRIERTADGGVVEMDGGRVEFDRLILACPLDAALSFLDASDEEQELFGKISSFPVWQMSVEISGIDDALIIDELQSYDHIGSAMIVFRYREQSNWYYLYGYRTPEQTGEQLIEQMRRDVAKLGGTVVSPPRLELWDGYFPHYRSAEVAAGYHGRLERLQGQRSTFYAGEIMANIGVEAVAAYSRRLVKQRFA